MKKHQKRWFRTYSTTIQENCKSKSWTIWPLYWTRDTKEQLQRQEQLIVLLLLHVEQLQKPKPMKIEKYFLLEYLWKTIMDACHLYLQFCRTNFAAKSPVAIIFLDFAWFWLTVTSNITHSATQMVSILRDSKTTSELFHLSILINAKWLIIEL